MTVTTTGYLKDNEGSYIHKDAGARLFYYLDWEDWLEDDTLTSVSYAIQSRANDAAPVVKHSEGIATKKTFVEISGGSVGKVYTVTATITTGGGLTDKRFFRVKVENRSA